MKRIWIMLGIILGIIVIGGVGYLGFRSSKPKAQTAPQAPQTVSVTRCDVEQSVTAPGTVANFQVTDIGMPVDGTLDKILVRPGDKVSAGDVLATLQNDPVKLTKSQQAVAQAQTDVVNAQDALEKAKSARAGLNISRTGDLAVERAELELALASTQLDSTQKAYDQVSGLPADDPERLMAMDALVAAKNEYYQKLGNYNWITGHASTQDISAADAKVSLAEANLALAQANLAKAQAYLDFLYKGVIIAPSDGVVLDTKAEIQKFTLAGTSLFTIHDPKNIEIMTTVTEVAFPFVKVGQKVTLYFDALPDVNATGVVSRIVPLRASGDTPLYYVYIRLDKVPDNLVDGMTADGAISIAQRQQVLCLPRAVVHASSGNTVTVKVWNGTTTEERQITIGLRGDVYVEILSGLKEGDQVVTQ